MKLVVYGEAPTAYPDDDNMYIWNEDLGTWDLITE